MPHLSTTDSIERVTLCRFGNVVEPTRILQSANAASGAILARAGLESSSVPSAGCAVPAASGMVILSNWSRQCDSWCDDDNGTEAMSQAGMLSSVANPISTAQRDTRQPAAQGV